MPAVRVVVALGVDAATACPRPMDVPSTVAEIVSVKYFRESCLSVLWCRVFDVPKRQFHFGCVHCFLSITDNQSIRLLHLFEPFDVCGTRVGRVRMQLFDKPNNRVRS